MQGGIRGDAIPFIVLKMPCLLRRGVSRACARVLFYKIRLARYPLTCLDLKWIHVNIKYKFQKICILVTGH